MAYFFNEEMTDECNNVIDRIKLIFESKKITSVQKEELFTSIMKMYLDSKEQ